MEKSSMFPCGDKPQDFPVNDAEKIDASVASHESKIYAAKKLGRFFEVDVTLKLFGQIVFTWHFPPIKND